MKTKMTCIVVMAALAMISSQTFAATVLNGGFEAPNAVGATSLSGVTNNWDYAPTAFQCGVIDQNDATFCPALGAVEGDQFAYLWCGGEEIAQNVSGFISGAVYNVQWSEAGRALTGAGGSLWVLMDTTTICANHAIPPDETFRTTNVTFTATATGHRLRFFQGGAWDRMIFVDDVTIIPEPATFGLLALVGLAFLRRK